MSLVVNRNNVSIVLHRPRYPENIGAAARAICNMGFEQLIVVEPENLDMTRVCTLATHAAAAVVNRLETYDHLKDALAAFQYVVGTTARLGGERQIVSSPAGIAGKIAPISQENRVAIVFGPEDRGLTNDDLRLCHALVNIPTADFSSLNLAQAVMVICYTLFSAQLPPPKEPVPRLASREELDGMYDQLKDILIRINYILPGNPDYWMNKIRRTLSRIRLRGGDVSILRGICRQIDWYSEKRYRDGLEDRAAGKNTAPEDN
ncbi:MAG: TrmJ/YjtD family RNA methyltransferase [Desulfobacteraceae bacterium]|nr:TrmJ/YjtD family RNA methyltransferase [Desulfobacteraceae bacterium]